MSEIFSTENLNSTNGSDSKVPADSLSAIHLQKTYGRRRVVDDVSLFVEQGEVVGLLGANGAGKTTTFYMMTGLERAEAGKILLEWSGCDEFADVSAGAARTGIFAAGTFDFSQNVGRTKYSRGSGNDENETRRQICAIRGIAEEFGIAHVRKTRGDALSGGERRRVEIARCLATEPQFILLDEPFAGIDPIAIDDIREIILYLKNHGIGILITDHNVRETLGICDRAYIMAEGKILRSGKPANWSKTRMSGGSIWAKDLVYRS